MLLAGESGDQFLVGVRFSAPLLSSPRDHSASYTMGTGAFLGINWLRSGADHTPQFSAEVQERVELYLYSPSGPLWPV